MAVLLLAGGELLLVGRVRGRWLGCWLGDNGGG